MFRTKASVHGFVGYGVKVKHQTLMNCIFREILTKKIW